MIEESRMSANRIAERIADTCPRLTFPAKIAWRGSFPTYVFNTLSKVFHATRISISPDSAGKIKAKTAMSVRENPDGERVASVTQEGAPLIRKIGIQK